MRNEAKLLIHEPPLQVLPTLAKRIGLNEAMVLQQLHYWLQNPKVGKEHGGHRWVFNTYEEWAENFPFWSVSTIRRIFTSLEGQGLVVADQLDKQDWDMRKSYRIDYEQMDALNMGALVRSEWAGDNKESETTSETTSEKPGILDGMRHFAQVAQEKGADEVEALLVRLEKGLYLNLPRGAGEQSVAKWILKKEKAGESLDDWLKWLKSDEWRKTHLNLYRNVSRIKTEWPQAFASKSSEALREIGPDGIDHGRYI